jgi:hypothetical protein
MNSSSTPEPSSDENPDDNPSEHVVPPPVSDDRTDEVDEGPGPDADLLVDDNLLPVI